MSLPLWNDWWDIKVSPEWLRWISPNSTKSATNCLSRSSKETHQEGEKQASKDLWGRRGGKLFLNYFITPPLLQFFQSATRELFFAALPHTPRCSSRTLSEPHSGILFSTARFIKKKTFIAVFFFFIAYLEIYYSQEELKGYRCISSVGGG